MPVPWIDRIFYDGRSCHSRRIVGRLSVILAGDSPAILAIGVALRPRDRRASHSLFVARTMRRKIIKRLIFVSVDPRICPWQKRNDPGPIPDPDRQSGPVGKRGDGDQLVIVVLAIDPVKPHRTWTGTRIAPLPLL